MSPAHITSSSSSLPTSGRVHQGSRGLGTSGTEWKLDAYIIHEGQYKYPFSYQAFIVALLAVVLFP